MGATYSKGMGDRTQDVFFIFNMISVFALDDIAFLHRFYRILQLWILLKPSVPDIAESAYKEISLFI